MAILLTVSEDTRRWHSIDFATDSSRFSEFKVRMVYTADNWQSETLIFNLK